VSIIYIMAGRKPDRFIDRLLSIIRDMAFYAVIFVFLFFLLYAFKTVIGINIFDDLSIEDFLGFLLSLFSC